MKIRKRGGRGVVSKFYKPTLPEVSDSSESRGSDVMEHDAEMVYDLSDPIRQKFVRLIDKTAMIMVVNKVFAVIRGKVVIPVMSSKKEEDIPALLALANKLSDAMSDAEYVALKDDPDMPARDCLCVPLRLEDERIGVFCVLDSRFNEGFGNTPSNERDNARLLAMLGEQLVEVLASELDGDVKPQ